MDPLTIGTAIGTGATLYRALRGGKKGPDIGRINSRFMDMRPGGYLTTADRQFADRQKAALIGTIGTGAEQQRSMARRRLGARGVGGAAAEQILKDITGGELVAREQAGSSINDLMYRIYGANRDFEREKMFRAWGAEIGDAGAQRNIAGAQDAAYWNSMIEFLPRLLDLKYSKGGVTTTETGAPVTVGDRPQ